VDPSLDLMRPAEAVETEVESIANLLAGTAFPAARSSSWRAVQACMASR